MLLRTVSMGGIVTREPFHATHSFVESSAPQMLEASPVALSPWPGNPMNGPSARARAALLLSIAISGGVSSPGCTELRGRRRIREGNRLYGEGRYKEALERYRSAEALVPEMPLLWLNEGLACRQLMIPGARTADSDGAVDCAVAAFERQRQLAPADPRAEQLLVQTLFDGDRFEALAARYGERLKKDPADLAAVGGM